MSFHPLVNARIRLNLFGELTSKMGPFAALKKLHNLTNDQVEQALADACQKQNVVLPKTFSVKGRLGDGHIWKAIEDFFNSPLGRVVLSVAVAILLSFMGL